LVIVHAERRNAGEGVGFSCLKRGACDGAFAEAEFFFTFGTCHLLAALTCMRTDPLPVCPDYISLPSGSLSIRK